jgi:hypothetical protein
LEIFHCRTFETALLIVFEPQNVFWQRRGVTYFKNAVFCLLAAFIFVFGTGCQKSETVARQKTPTPLSPDTIVRVHWQGTRQLGYEAGAFYLMQLWKLSASAQLEKQTIDELTTAPKRLLSGGTNLTDAASAGLRPLFYDLLQEECYFEISQPANQAAETVLALRLNDDGQAGRWQTNLAAVLEPLTGARAVVDSSGTGWSLKKNTAPDFVELARVGDWTIIGVARDKNVLFDETVTHIRADHAPFFSAGTNLWLEAEIDSARVANLLGKTSSKNLPHLSLSVTGDGGNVIARGHLNFPQPLAARLEPWRIPVNLIHEPLISFTAIRGLQPWLTASRAWSDLGIGAAPDQLYFWSLEGSAYQTYLAAPLADANRQISALTDLLLQKGNPWLAKHGYINFDRAPDANGVTWGNLPSLRPFIKAAGFGADSWLFAGLFPDIGADTNRPAPEGMIHDILSRTNLVYYDWEVTGPRVNSVLYLGQTARQISRRAQMPLDSVSMNCLSTLLPRLGTSATIINLTAPDQLTFFRKSTVGFTAPELHFLADWLESPEFPRGLHSILAPANPPAQP